MDLPNERLLVVDDPRAVEGLHVTQKVSPRVMLVDEAPRNRDGLLAVLAPGDVLADDLRRTLTGTELLFVDAFTRRARAKDRPGDGLRWDAEGFEPPDER